MGALDRQSLQPNMKRPDMRLQRRPGLTDPNHERWSDGFSRNYIDGVRPSNMGASMSMRALIWAFGLIEGSELSAPERIVLLSLAQCHNQETGRCDPSVMRLCKMTGLGRRTVQRSVETLTLRELIAVRRTMLRIDSKSKQLRNNYRLRGGATVARGGCHSGAQTRNMVARPSAPFDLANLIDVEGDE